MSNDGNEAAFARNFKNMPWLATQYGGDGETKRNVLQQRYGIMELPAFVVLDATNGQVVSHQGVNDLQVEADKAMNKWETDRQNSDKQ